MLKDSAKLIHVYCEFDCRNLCFRNFSYALWCEFNSFYKLIPVVATGMIKMLNKRLFFFTFVNVVLLIIAIVLFIYMLCFRRHIPLIKIPNKRNTYNQSIRNNNCSNNL